MDETEFEPVSVSFPDGGVWTRETTRVISYTGPLGPNRWEWKTATDASISWLAICTH